MLCLFALSMVLSAWALPPDEKKVTLDLKDGNIFKHGKTESWNQHAL